MLKPPAIETRSQLEQLTKALDTMTIARPAAIQVLTIVDDPNSTVPRLAGAIELDPALTTQIMRLANSAFYGMSGRVGNAGFAVTVIGFSAVRSLAAVSATGLDGSGVTKPARFWEHAAATAAACAAIAPTYGIPNGDAFAAGLLHDLGTALLHRFDPRGHASLVDQWGHDGLALRDAEATTLGLGHDDAAARVLRAWNFPDAMVEAVANHHRPLDGALPFTKLLIAGDTLTELIDLMKPLGRVAFHDDPADNPDDAAGDEPADADDEPDGAPDETGPITDEDRVAIAGAKATLIEAGIAEDRIDQLVGTTAQKAYEVLASLPTG